MPTLEAQSRIQTSTSFEVARVDRSSNTIRDAVILTGETEALGHGVYVDEAGVQQAAKLLLGRSLPAYATHDGLWRGDRLFEQIGFFSGFYLDGLKLRASQFSFLRAFEEHQPEKRDILLELAESAPTEFGLSIVFDGEAVWKLEDGTETPAMSMRRPEGALGDMPVQRFARIESADFVKSPAANPEGLFSAQVDQPAAGMNQEPAAAAPAEQPDIARQFSALQSDFEKASKTWQDEREAFVKRAAELEQERDAMAESLDQERKAWSTEKADLERQLSAAQALSAARLGVPPLEATPADGATVTKDNFWALYHSLPPNRRSAFYRTHREMLLRTR
jgi:hypothetical protein